MKTSFNNPWFEVVLTQMWVWCQATEVVAKCIDSERLSDPQALTRYGLHPSEQRLNPLEFHGKRRSAAASTAPRDYLIAEKPISD
jgi:hypothetical protein